MNLYNCETREELKLKEVKLEDLTDSGLLKLASKIRSDFKDEILQDENIVIDAMMEIIITQARRKVGLE